MSLSHLISIRDLTREEAILILDTAEQMAATQRHGVKKLPTLQGKTVVNLFFEDSTRTRISFETAAKRLSADVINFQSRGSSVSKGESLKDTALTLEAMGADAVIVRHSSSGAAHRLAHAGWMNLPVLNAGDGTHQHPTQALLDAMTLRRHYAPSLGNDGTPAPGSGLDGAHVVIVGDVLHSRVARSNVDLLTLLGARVTLVAPPTLLPIGVETWNCAISYNFDEALAHRPDAVMMPARFATLVPSAVVMHPGPMNRGLEICAEAADSDQSVIVEQVSNGVCIRMAALYLLLASEGHSND